MVEVVAYEFREYFSALTADDWLQQLIATPSRLGRSSHGSYPFPGLYKDVGPSNTGELVNTRWDIFRQAPESTASL